MKTVKIIEAIYDNEDEKYRILHDFNKEDVSEQDVSDVMFDIIHNIRCGLQDTPITDTCVHCVDFEDDIMTEVSYMIEIWDNIPLDLMNDYIENHDNIKKFIDNNLWFIISGFCIDSPFDGGGELFEHLGIEDN